MTVLSDSQIEHLIDRLDLVTPYNEKQLQPASYDVQLLAVRGATLIGTEQWVIEPKQFVLGSTMERVTLPSDIVARIEGKSSWARRGLIVHTAGFIDPGFSGTLTLEITNLSDEPITVRAGDLIAQIAFQQMGSKARKPYGHPDLGSHYQNQSGITPSVLQMKL